MAKVQIYTDAFQDSHGHKPRGWGCWGFDVIDTSCNQKVAEFFVPYSMTYGEAKKWATAHILEKWHAEWATGYLALEVSP